MSDDDLKQMFDALTAKLAEIFAADLEFGRQHGHKPMPIDKQRERGVKRVVRVTETWVPTYEDSANVDLELIYFDASDKLQDFSFSGVSCRELLRSGEVPQHSLTWSVMQP